MKTSCKPLAFIFLLIIFVSGANAEESKEEYNQKESIYFHPFSSLFIGVWEENGWSTSFYDDKSSIFIAYLTFEIPLSLSNSLIIQPSFWKRSGPFLDKFLHYDDDIEKRLDGLFRLGLGIGLRHFVNGKGEGLYFQAISSVNYYSITEWNRIKVTYFPYKEINYYYKKGFYADLLGYLGYSWKFSRLRIFFDVGAGIGTIYPTDDNSSYGVITLGYKKPLTLDSNLGIGFSF